MGASKTQAVRRVRRDPRRETTRAALIEAAETLFADSGVESVSLRQIGTAIGSGNTSVVFYHFGSKEALIEEIFMHRVPALEARRAELLAVAMRVGSARDLPTLVHALWWPVFEQTNADGRHSYAAFLASISRANLGWLRRSMEDSFPVTKDLVARIGAAIPREARRFSKETSRIAFAIIAAALQHCDQHHRRSPKRAKALFSHALRIAAAAMTVPGR